MSFCVTTVHTCYVNLAEVLLLLIQNVIMYTYM